MTSTISELVERFGAERARVRRADYNETEARVQYINPLFAALGWDMDNALGRGEVKHEDKLRIEQKAKAPDYGFYLDGRRRFFVEAKKPALRLDKMAEPAYQLRRYAWTAKLAVSVLTDFEEFAVYDARIRPRAGCIKRRRMLWITYPIRFHSTYVRTTFDSCHSIL